MLVAANASSAKLSILRTALRTVCSFNLNSLSSRTGRLRISPSARRHSSSATYNDDQLHSYTDDGEVEEISHISKSASSSSETRQPISGAARSNVSRYEERPKGKAKSHFASEMDRAAALLKPLKKMRRAPPLHITRRVPPPQFPGSPSALATSEAGKPSPNSKKHKGKKLARDLQTVKELIKEEGWQPENWKDAWGTDELTVKETSQRSLSPPHIRSKFPSYTRRIEGLLESSPEDILQEVEPPSGRHPIATLAHGLDRVLFNPGVHWVQDSRSRVYNFPPPLQSIPDISDFAFDRLTPFIKSSRDKTMQALTVAEGRRFAGSTSSLSGLMSHIYFLISQDHTVDTSTLSKDFAKQPVNFTPGQRMPASVVFNHRDGVYLVDSDSTDNDDSRWNVLTWMGTMLEKFLTLPPDEFKLLLHSSGPCEPEKKSEAYRYSKSNTFIMRSQLDCYDPRLPGSGVFDIKTRAVLPIRLDNLNFKENSGYLIKTLHGPLESFEKEYYDLVRAAFLKYSFQARIGNMDGIFVAYHNTARMFGFQYIPLEELDERLFGAKDRGWRVFDKCVGMLELISQEIVDCYPGRTVTCLAETLENTNILRIWVQPVEKDSETNDDTLPVISTEQTRPIIQLDVTADSYIEGANVGGNSAVNSSDKPWTIHWSISRSSLSEQAIRRNFENAKSRKFRPYLFPTGVDSGNLEDFMQNIGFGQGNNFPNVQSFVKAGPNIELLRALSRAGSAETERRELDEESREKFVWHQADYPENEVKGTVVATITGENTISDELSMTTLEVPTLEEGSLQDDSNTTQTP